MAVAFGVLNVASYALTLVAAHALGPAEYGQFSALIGLLTIATVASLGLQATAARRVAAHPAQVEETERHLLAATWRWAAGVTLLLLALTPVLHAVLDLDAWGGLVLTAAAAGLLTFMGGQLGLLQGKHRWTLLAVVYAAMGLGRLGVGAAALALRPTTSLAMAGVAVGAVIPVAIAGLALRHHRRSTGGAVPASPSTAEEEETKGLAQEVAHSVHLLLAFFVLSNVDALLARAVLPPHDAGLFAAGLIVSKSVLFLPQFVVVVAFPSMAREDHTRRAERGALALVLVIGALATLAVLSLSGMALAFAGGAAYRAAEGRLWAFAAAGTLLAAVQLVVYAALARGRRTIVWLVWGAAAVFVAAGVALATSESLLAVKVASAGLLLASLVVLSGRRRPGAEPVDGPGQTVPR